MDWKLKMERSELFEWVKETYGTAPDYPWNDWNAVLRHAESKKWYAVILEVSVQKLGLAGNQIIDILNVKSDPLLIGRKMRESVLSPPRLPPEAPFRRGIPFR